MTGPNITCGRDKDGNYTIHIDGNLRGKFRTPEIMQAHFASLLACSLDVGGENFIPVGWVCDYIDALTENAKPLSPDSPMGAAVKHRIEAVNDMLSAYLESRNTGT